MEKKEREYMAVIEKIVKDGKHGPYAVARSDEIGLITFALNEKVWKEKDIPEPGMIVFLSEVRKKRAGWRALIGRYMCPSDENKQKTVRSIEK